MSLRLAALPVRRAFAFRSFSVSATHQKTLTDSVKETAQTINKKVGETLASGIDVAESATESAKNTVKSTDAAAKAEGVKQDANQKMGKAAGKMRDAKDEVKKNM